jgi:hypothetical protein
MRRSLYITAEKESTELRFAVGDKVLVNMGDWTLGVVVRQWHQEQGWEVRASSAALRLSLSLLAFRARATAFAFPPPLTLPPHLSMYLYTFLSPPLPPSPPTHSTSPRVGLQRTRSASTALSRTSLRRSITTA